MTNRQGESIHIVLGSPYIVRGQVKIKSSVVLVSNTHELTTARMLSVLQPRREVSLGFLCRGTGMTNSWFENFRHMVVAARRLWWE